MRVFPPADDEPGKNNIHNFQENFSASAKCAKQSQKGASEIEDLQSRLLPLCLGQLIQNCLLCLFAVAAAPIGVPASLCLFALSLGPVCAPLLCRPTKRRLLLLAHALGCGWLFLLMASICVWLAHYIRQITTSSSRQPSLELECVFVPTFLLANLALCLFWLQRLIVVFLPIWWRRR